MADTHAHDVILDFVRFFRRRSISRLRNFTQKHSRDQAAWYKIRIDSHNHYRLDRYRFMLIVSLNSDIYPQNNNIQKNLYFKNYTLIIFLL